MASERSEFIKRQAAALQVASVNRGPAQVGVKVKPAEVRRRNECVVGAAIDAATTLADALGLRDEPSAAGGETYAIDRVAADEWFGIFDGVPPIPENERRMYLAIAAARGKGAT